MGEMRKTRKLIYLKLPCVGGSNLPSVKSILSENVVLFFQSFFGSKLLCGLTPGAGSAVPRLPASLLWILCASSVSSCGETPSKAIAVGVTGGREPRRSGSSPGLPALALETANGPALSSSISGAVLLRK